MLPGTACNSELSLTLSVKREFVFFTSAAENLDADRGARAALILPPSGTAEEKDARFYETVCRNWGWNVNVFSDRNQAIRWLTKKEFSNKLDAGDA
jgi:hypothetical protein